MIVLSNDEQILLFFITISSSSRTSLYTAAIGVVFCSYVLSVCSMSFFSYVDDATNDVKFSAFLRGYMDEVTSTIKNVSIELERYKEKIVERFGNRMMKDLLSRICEDGSAKFYNTVKDCLTVKNLFKCIVW